MSLAYFITAHKNPLQVGRLLRAIQGKSMVVHYDLKAPEKDRQEMAEIVAQILGARLAKRPRKVEWAAWSLVQAELDGMKELLEDDPDWTHFIPLSGQCFPLVRPEVVEAFCQAHPDQSFLELFDAEQVWGPDETKARYRRAHIRRGRRRIPLPIPLPALDTPIYGASQWKILSREACAYLVGPETAHLRRHFRRTWVPDEAYFATALMNGPLAARTHVAQKHYIDWNVPIPPKILTLEDLPKLEASGAFFARKLDPGDLLDILAERLKR
ncbi:MAG TPA: beta-1,6-N-acetylglucosaminyltransferase [Fimbriimonadaceae bacterium]|nr:beta-1,6-N-acetylglucosaminyltransferase [Fimbriimonadaceae bacterium]